MTAFSPKTKEWADLSRESMERLVRESEKLGWRQALEGIGAEHPFFAHRLRDLGLANWHLIFARSREERAFDVGCGFGSLALGLSHYYRRVTGLDAVESRVKFARLRALQERLDCTFLTGSALELPVAAGSIDLVTLNGVLEWAALFARGRPQHLQERLLTEVRRVLTSTGIVAIAIENRFAMETLVGMPDTHTGLRLAPALPRALASLQSSVVKREPYRAYLHSAGGLRRLARKVGFADVKALDLVSSYNDYDFVVDVSDTASYRLMWQHDLVRSFYPRAAAVRRAMASALPALLGRVGYAFLVVMGERPVTTLLDRSHPLWEHVQATGASPGRARFAIKGSAVPSISIVCHDGARASTLVDLRSNAHDQHQSSIPDRIIRALNLHGGRSSQITFGDLDVSVHDLR